MQGVARGAKVEALLGALHLCVCVCVRVCVCACVVGWRVSSHCSVGLTATHHMAPQPALEQQALWPLPAATRGSPSRAHSARAPPVTRHSAATKQLTTQASAAAPAAALSRCAAQLRAPNLLALVSVDQSKM
jgi:hypothetical protein